jgi:hypothetical protein
MNDIDDLIVERAIEIITQLRKERDEARADAERWQDDALRLLRELNASAKENTK